MPFTRCSAAPDWNLVVALALVSCCLAACTAPGEVDARGKTVEVAADTPAREAVDVPEGVADGDASGENSDADGFCFDPEAGYFPCDDGAPPGSGPPGGATSDEEPSPGLDGSAGRDDDDDDDDDGGDDGGGDDGGGGGGGEVCAEDTFQQGAPLPPRILLVVDKSGSMDDAATGYPGSKWQGAREALGAVLATLDDEAELGLMLYPNGDADDNVCRRGAVEVQVGPGRAGRIQQELFSAVPGGGTPTATTLERARQTLLALDPEGGPRVVVLATDGGPNCNDGLDPDSCRCVNAGGCNHPRNCLDIADTRAAAEALGNAGVPVFVIGIPGSENFTDVLNDLADAGGTALFGPTRFYAADDSNALAEALEQIAARVASCRFDLAGPVSDPGTVTVTVGSAPIPRDPTRAFGWDLVDDDTLELFGAACAEAERSPFGVTVGYCFAPGG